MVSAGRVLAAQREVPTLLYAPAGRGPWPLLLIVHGLNVGPERYDHLVALGRAAGQLVLTPSVAQEDPARGFPLDRDVLRSTEPHDLSAVLDAVAASPYGARVDWSRVTVLGHSDGADAALELGFDAPVRDRRVDRVVALEADPLPFTPTPGGPWLLVVHGDHDELVPYADGRSVFSAMAGTRSCMATVIGGTHTGSVWNEDATAPSLDATVRAFLAAASTSRARCPAVGTTAPAVRLEAAT